jgi:short subunit dehydrogenase-like uncharacterized protein
MKVRFDVLIYGASGFTGQLAVKYLRTTYPSLKWGVAGRSAAKLRDLVDSENQIVVADSSNEASLDAMTASTRVLLTFAGPFALIGSGVVASCVRSKTHYVDITGEVPWVRKMIDAYDEGAKAAKVKIVHCSGFDSIPSDIGCLHMINALRSRQVSYAPHAPHACTTCTKCIHHTTNTSTTFCRKCPDSSYRKKCE